MNRRRPFVLVVDRESEDTRRLLAFLRERDLEVAWARDGESAFNVMDETRVNCLVTELRDDRIDGMRLLKRVRELNPAVCAVMIAEGADVERAVEAMRQGAHDFQVKPLHLDKLMAVLEHGLAVQAMASRMARMEERLDERLGFERLTGSSRAIQRVMEQVRHVAPTGATVLIEGEAGTGKELVAQAIHQHSPRKDERFVAMHCAALPGDAFEAELFGQEEGADDSKARQPGRIELADDGTLFLDEVGGVPAGAQIRLLRMLQDRAFERIGGGRTLTMNARVIASTALDLPAEVRAGRFREDLYFRLSVARITLPPLRERREDIPTLVETFLRDLNREHARKVSGITRGALDRLVNASWPGNVRELRSTLEGMVVLTQGRRRLELSDLPAALREGVPDVPPLGIEVGMTVEEAERHLITATLRHAEGDKPRAASLLGIGLRTLYRKLKRYGLL